MEYLSLFDYLGKPAGAELGLSVATMASKSGIEIKTREVSNLKYTGIVNLYPKDFLEFYFKKPDSLDMEDDFFPTSGDIEDYDLPF